ncbi:MAG: hypothetical protein WA709_36250 [Stellaceae bacterium]
MELARRSAFIETVYNQRFSLVLEISKKLERVRSDIDRLVGGGPPGGGRGKYSWLDEYKIAVIASYYPINSPADKLEDFNLKERSRCRLAADAAGGNFEL